MECKPFRKSHDEQIKLIGALSWFNADALEGLSDEVYDILSPSEAVEPERRIAIAAAVTERCGRIEKLKK